MSEAGLVLAGRLVPEAESRIRRYCGLAWDGGEPETWAWAYYDAIRTNPDHVDVVDVVSCAALHPGLSRSDLGFFVDRRGQVDEVIAALPGGCDLADAGAETVQAVIGIAELAGCVSLSLISKVLHRKRPKLVPLLDGAIIDWYRPVTGLRGPAAWRPLIEQLRADMADPGNRGALAAIAGRIGPELAGVVPSQLRMADIAIWMGQR